MNTTLDSAALGFVPGTYLDLPLSTDVPDYLGFGQVSGLYGPGPWSGFFLVIVASWLHLFYVAFGMESKFDFNMCAYLLWLGWMAIDLLQHSKKLDTLYRSVPASSAWQEEAASVGAALTTVLWGTMHGMTQAFLYFCADQYSPKTEGSLVKRRLYTLAVGLILPSVSLTITGKYLGIWHDGHEIIDVIPALYWEHMKATPEQSADSSKISAHSFYIAAALHFGLCCLIMCFTFLTFSVDGVARTIFMYMAWLGDKLIADSPIFLSFPFILLFFMFISSIPFLAPTIFLVILTDYFSRAHGLGLSHPPQTCFLMPCAPQSIGEMDQSGALFVGLVLLVGVEILSPLYGYYKKRRQDQRQFEQYVDESLRVGRIQQLFDNGRNRPGAQRVNSGIELEEGNALGQRNRTGTTIGNITRRTNSGLNQEAFPL